MGANNRQVGGAHYQTPTGRQHWDLVVEYQWDYFQAQITKYVMRWKKKNGVEDLKKAAHFLEKYIEVAEQYLNKIPEAHDVHPQEQAWLDNVKEDISRNHD